ncbi:MAG: patatin-like phospholipase family protein [Gammaproteobacteria bacterium]|nr:patatin-like phospholipase family protein [Gammaproteobacteria bacterium]
MAVLLWLSAITCLAGLPRPVLAQGTCLEAPGGKRIGLVLSGGGARGTAHVGVLEVLERLRIPVHCVAGTSMGSVVGALYALGMPAPRIRTLVADVDWNRGFVDEFPRERLPLRRKDEEDDFLIKFELGVRDRVVNLPLGVVQGHSLNLLLKELVGGASLVDDFDQLPIPFRAVATDIESADVVALGQGDLATAVQASMAIPGVFSPVELDGRLLVDGGVSQNLPVSVVKSMGADIVIAVDIGTPLSQRDQLTSVVTILDQLTNVLTQKNVGIQERLLTAEDVLIRPDLAVYTSMDFGRAAEIVDLGKFAAEQQSAELAALSISAGEYARYRDSLRQLPTLPASISGVKVHQQSKLPSSIVVQGISVEDDEGKFSLPVLNQSLNAIHSTGLFERVGYRYERTRDEPPEYGLVVRAEQKNWGPDLIRFGFSLEDDFAGNNSFNLSAGYLRKAVNRAGGDIRAIGRIGETPGLLLEYYQPLATLSETYMLAQFDHQQFSQGVFNDSTQTGQFRTRRNELGFYMGHQIAHHSDLRAGVKLGSGRVKRRVGDDSIADREEFAEGAIVIGYRYDTLDSIRFPGSGDRFRITLESSATQLGADEAFDAVSLDALTAYTLGTTRLVGSLSIQTATRNSLPIQKLFSRGGLLNTSGFSENLLVGQHAGRLGFALYEPLRSNQIDALNFPVYIGMSMDVGGVFLEREDINSDNAALSAHVFVAADTPLGPAILGVGGTRGQGLDALLSLGVTF